MSRTEPNRVLAWRPRILRQAREIPGNVAQTCRRFGISRQTFYKWSARCGRHGEAGLCDRPRAAHHCPRATPRLAPMREATKTPARVSAKS